MSSILRVNRSIVKLTGRGKLKVLAAVFVITGVVIVFVSRDYHFLNNFVVLRVAHAGGAVYGLTYTNSLEALNHNYAKGFRYFELDFNYTRDGNLVCLHDWDKVFKKLWGYTPQEVLNLAEFEVFARQNPAGITPCTMSSLAQWMSQHPDAKVITDVKDHNVKALASMRTLLPDAQRRVIPQVYQPDNFSRIKRLGYESIIWTLYQFDGSVEDVLTWTDSFSGNFAVAMNRKFDILPILVPLLSKRNIPVYVHTVNSSVGLTEYREVLGVSEVYTDSLPPQYSE